MAGFFFFLIKMENEKKMWKNFFEIKIERKRAKENDDIQEQAKKKTKGGWFTSENLKCNFTSMFNLWAA